MTEEHIKQIQFAKSHSNVANGKGACAFKGKKLLISGYSRLPLQYHYTSADSQQYPELHISAMQDLIIKLGSYRRVSYEDLDVVLSEPPTFQEITLIVEMGFKKMWILGEPKAFDPIDYFHEALAAKGVRF